MKQRLVELEARLTASETRASLAEAKLSESRSNAYSLGEAVMSPRQHEGLSALMHRIGGVGGIDVNLTDKSRPGRLADHLKLHVLPSDTLTQVHGQWFARLHPDDRLIAEQRLFAALESKASIYDSQYRIILPSDGEVRWIHARAEIERDDAGTAIRIVGTRQDVTEAKLAQERLRVEEEHNAFLLELSNALRPIGDPVQVQRIAIELLGEKLQVDRAIYYRVETVGSGYAYVVDNEWRARPGISRVAVIPGGDADYGGNLFTDLENGISVKINDLHAATDASLKEGEQYAGAGLRALIAVPICKNFRQAGGISVQTIGPRRWTDGDVRLVEEVAERTRNALERVWAQAALRASEASLRCTEDWLAAQKEFFQVAMDGGSLEDSLKVLSRTMVQAGDGRRCAFCVANEAGEELEHVIGMGEAYAEAVKAFRLAPSKLAYGLAVATTTRRVPRDILGRRLISTEPQPH
ncbi:PAS domain-containing protein (plasmid) [Novosphingobium sp. BL-8A]|uniref:GAF domain-containing protein n=1 Tax=Novosphingobium sp. BL-8A TaxID=3127639 RepID=UPI0037566B79